jgi:hypothetical protein
MLAAGRFFGQLFFQHAATRAHKGADMAELWCTSEWRR